MPYEKVTISLSKLREYLKEESMLNCKYYEYGYEEPTDMELEIDAASPKRLLEMAQDWGINLREFQVRE